MMRLTVAGALLFAMNTLVAQGPLQDDLRAQFAARLDTIVRAVDGVVGYSIVDLRAATPVAARLEREPFPTASAIKVPILYELLKLLWKGEGLTPARRDVGRQMMRLVSGAIRSAVPARVDVFSKTGSLTGVRAETAIVDVPGAPFGITVMTTYLREDAAGSRAIGEIAAAAYAYFDRVATSGKYGRRP